MLSADFTRSWKPRTCPHEQKEPLVRIGPRHVADAAVVGQQCLAVDPPLATRHEREEDSITSFRNNLIRKKFETGEVRIFILEEDF